MPADKVRICKIPESLIEEGLYKWYKVRNTREEIDKDEDEENSAHHDGISQGDVHSKHGLGLTGRWAQHPYLLKSLVRPN